MKTKNLIIGGSILAVAGYLAYKKGLFKKKEITNLDILENQIAEKDAIQSADDTFKAKQYSESLLNRNSFSSKVAKVQLFLGTTPDGIVGPNTLLALKNRLPQYTTITSKNIDKILIDINAKIKVGYKTV